MTDYRSNASREVLARRAKLKADIRTFFDHHGFLEVDTPLLSRDTVVDRHLDPIAVEVPDADGQAIDSQRMWLQTSPEFHMKRLLSSGLDRIYQIGPAFRAGEAGAHHNPEFTMVEWYRVGDDMRAGMRLLGELACELFQSDDFDSIAYDEAFEAAVGVSCTSGSPDEWLAAAESRQVSFPAMSHEFDQTVLLDCLWTECVQPGLGLGRPVLVYHYPADQSALAQVVSHDGRPVAERFELFVQGIELANGYHELLDPDELLRRNETNNQWRQLNGKKSLPNESRLLDAMRDGLPQCAGVALGFDRSLMLLTGATNIASVLPFAIDRA